MAGPEFAYVQARLQARHGGAPGALAWQALETSHTPGHYLNLARSGPMARWVEGLTETGDAHRIEQHLRASWRRYVEEVARWQPARWQAATRCFAALPELALAEDAVNDPTGARWLAQWQRTMPTGGPAPALLRRAAELLTPSLSAAGGARGLATPPVRRALMKLFRRHGASPVAAFAHLALVALDVERLRGGIVTRALLPPPQAAGPPGGHTTQGA